MFEKLTSLRVIKQCRKFETDPLPEEAGYNITLFAGTNPTILDVAASIISYYGSQETAYSFPRVYGEITHSFSTT